MPAISRTRDQTDLRSEKILTTLLAEEVDDFRSIYAIESHMKFEGCHALIALHAGQAARTAP